MSAAQPFSPMDYDNKRFVARLLVLHRVRDTLPPGWDAQEFESRWQLIGLPPFRAMTVAAAGGAA